LDKELIPLENIRECITRSGYLLESRLVRRLTELNYFVEPNQALLDPRTGKSREIDLIAEYYRHNLARQGVYVKTCFVVEAINNRFPFILLTERPYTPNADFESYIKYIRTPVDHDFVSEIDLYEEKGADWKNLFSQYCVLTRKNASSELMATHTDDVFGSLLKLSEYVEAEIESWNSGDDIPQDEHWRLFFWNPMLVLSGQLVAGYPQENGNIDIMDIPIGRLEFNWQAGKQKRTTIIEVVTEEFFYERLENIVKEDDGIEEKIHTLYRKRK
jgi:hypothetical protein